MIDKLCIQVFAVLVGGLFLQNGRISSEQLTKYVLYCEWLMYATSRIGQNFSSLMQSVGASENVFTLMELLPSNQFVSKGKHTLYNSLSACAYLIHKKSKKFVHFISVTIL